MTRYTPLWEQQGSYSANVDRRLIAAVWPGPASVGCAVTVATVMTVNVAPGTVAAPTPNGTGSTLCYSDAVEQVTVTAAPGSGLNRIDLIICRPRGNDLDGGANNDFIFDYVTGNAAATATVPPTPPGTVALAQILIPGGSAAIVAGNITDVRPGGLAGDTAWTNVSGFTNGYTATAITPRYLRLGNVVYLTGAVTGGTPNTSAFTLPAGYRPSSTNSFAVAGNNAFCILTVAANGTVTPVTTGTAVNLDVSFPTV